ncbi:MAG: hypothetical protein KAY22_08185 [Rhizorhabdus sp.]|uniref:hypothetical protein n=1 Tax=Rhizorhabdus sp. TaxID=1968843 RepID=UPI001B4765CB|nr:hypothetical protein [Rhizorhabdus sp.]MBP8232266.1 hypothetical protein [Rhizorhabdus sp.]
MTTMVGTGKRHHGAAKDDALAVVQMSRGFSVGATCLSGFGWHKAPNRRASFPARSIFKLPQRKCAIVQGWFAIDVEKDLKLIRLTMGGFFESATIVEMRTRMVEAIATLACAANDHLTLCDICEMDIQSQERVGEFAKLVGSDDVRSRRLAFVTARSLARLQAKRLTSREGVEFFTDPDMALDWLTG